MKTLVERFSRRPPPWLATLLLATQGLASSTAESAAADRRAGNLEELGEVVVSGERPTRKLGEMIPWLRRLSGRYTYEGYVDLGGNANPGDRLRVHGSGVCVAFGVAPGVQCEINVSWPEMRAADRQEIMGGISALKPAMILFGLDPDELAIHSLQVDNKGFAEGGMGYVFGDTAVFRAQCVDQPPGCERITRITAVSDSPVIDMQIDTEVDYRLTMRFRFVLRRVAQSQPAPVPRKRR